MVNYSDIFPLSTGSGNNQIIVVNTNTTLNKGGFYQTGNLTADIEIDISNVPVNDEIAFYNTSTNNVVIFGISTVDNVSIPTNKGVNISPNNGGGFIKNISDNINKRLGSYTVDWIPGQKPIGQYLPFTSTTTLNGVVNWLGTNFETSSFSNPYPSLIGITGKVTTLDHNTPTVNNPSYLTNKSSADKITFTALSNTSSDVGVLVSLPSGKTLIPTTIAVFFGNDSGLGSASVDLKVEGQKENGDFEVIGVVTCAGNSNVFRVFNYSGSSKFKGFYIHCPNMYYCSLREFEAWGFYD